MNDDDRTGAGPGADRRRPGPEAPAAARGRQPAPSGTVRDTGATPPTTGAPAPGPGSAGPAADAPIDDAPTDDALVDDALVDLAGRLADAASAVTRRWFRRLDTVDTKADASPVTVADRDAEAAIREILAVERPEDGIVGEEHGSEGADARHVWVIDPIDGTKAFISGKPTFGTLIALLQDGRPVLGVIDQPIVGDRWIGAAGRPTLFNGAPARTRACESLDRALLAATAPDMFQGADAEAFARVSSRCAATVWGGDCYAYGLMAAGFGDLVIEAGLKIYDWAALVPIVAGAGGAMTDWSGAPLAPGSTGRVIAAGDPRMHREALALLRP